ncbi:MAG: hypothetical protein EVA87_00370 [Rhodospirillaceae bacterium]|nr:MAG: hypothetical protein EVA87_00370 [Rhodospirillaceae bacterium]
MKTSQTTPRVAAAIAGVALFLGAAAAAGIERGNNMVGSGIVVSAPESIWALDIVTTVGSSYTE